MLESDDHTNIIVNKRTKLVLDGTNIQIPETPTTTMQRWHVSRGSKGTLYLVFGSRSLLIYIQIIYNYNIVSNEPWPRLCVVSSHDSMKIRGPLRIFVSSYILLYEDTNLPFHSDKFIFFL